MLFRSGSGSGVILDTFYLKSRNEWHTYILTAAHVVLVYEESFSEEVDEADPPSCISGHDEEFGFVAQEIWANDIKAELLKWDSHVDLALLKIVTPAYPQGRLNGWDVDLQSATLSARGSKPTEEVWSVGFPGYSRTVSRGYVGESGYGEFSHSAAINSGSSGGGVFRDGKLIGINYATACDSKDIFGAVPVLATGVGAIEDFLKDEYSYLAKTDSIVTSIRRLWR